MKGRTTYTSVTLCKYTCSLCKHLHSYVISFIGASLSEPHLVRMTPALSVYMYVMPCVSISAKVRNLTCHILCYTSISATHSLLQLPHYATHCHSHGEARSMEVTHG